MTVLSVDKPSPPLNLKVKETSKDYVVLAWESPETDGGSPLTGFIVERKDVTKTTFVSAGRCDANTFYFKVAKLIEGNEYEFHVAAENDVGQSDWASLDKPVKAKHGFGDYITPYSSFSHFYYVFTYFFVIIFICIVLPVIVNKLRH